MVILYPIFRPSAQVEYQNQSKVETASTNRVDFEVDIIETDPP